MKAEHVSEPVVHDLLVDFDVCDAGWIPFGVIAVIGDGADARGVCLAAPRATHMDDPFPAMLVWLEAIIAGTIASWTIAEEGSVVRMTYLPPIDEMGERAGGQLLCSQASERNLLSFEGCSVDPRTVVRSFYTSFRQWVASDGYVRASGKRACRRAVFMTT